MKNITSKSVRDWEAQWKAFMYFGLVLTVLAAGAAWHYGKKNFTPRFGWVLAAYGVNGVGAAGVKIPDFNLPARQIVRASERVYGSQKDFRLSVQAFYWSPVVGYSLSLVILLAFGRVMARAKRADKHLRGAELSDIKTIIKMLRGNPSNFELGGVPVPTEIEPVHFLFVGGIGSGKTLAFRQVLEAIRRQDQRAVIADPGGEFVSSFFREGDVLLNPFDARAASWSPFAEMRGPWDAERLSKSIIPDGKGAETEWNLYAQQIFAAVLERLWSRGNATNGELVRLLTIAESAEMRDLVTGLPAQRMFEAGNEKFLGSVLAIVSSYAKPLSWLDPAAGQGSFSIRRWIENEPRGWIFLTYRDDQLASLRPLLAAWLDVVASAILTLPEDRERRVWLVLDEFAGLGRIQSIEPFLTKARKCGGCALLGLQALSQLYDTYGREKAKTLLSSLGTWLVLRQSDPETAEVMSLYLGDREVLRQNESGSKGGDGSGNWSEQVAKTRLVMPAELQHLAPRHGYLSVLGPYPVCPVEMVIPDKQPEAAPAFVLREQKESMAAPKQSGELDFAGW